MATVRITDTLKSDVNKAIMDMYERRMNSTSETRQARVLQDADLVYAKLFAPYMAHINALPGDFFNMADSFVLKEVGGVKLTLPMVHNFTSQKRFPVRSAKMGAFEVQSWGYPHSPRTAYLVIHYVEGWEDLFVAVQQLNAELQKLKEDRDTFRVGVRKVLDAHATLAPALKAWPPLWDLLSEEVKNRHREVNHRRTKGGASIDADLDTLTGLAVANKFVR